jgi:hypothetical protein
MSKDANLIEQLLIELDKQDEMNRETRKLAYTKGLRAEALEADRLINNNFKLRELLLSYQRSIVKFDGK